MDNSFRQFLGLRANAKLHLPMFKRIICEDSMAQSAASGVNQGTDDMACALCRGQHWEIIHATPQFAKLCGVDPLGQDLRQLLKNISFTTDMLEAQPEGGECLLTPGGGTPALLRWTTLHGGAAAVSPALRLVDITTAPGPCDSATLCEREQAVLLDSMHDGIWVIDANGITQRVNKSMERIAGIREQDMVGRHVAEAMRDNKYTTCVTLRALEEKRPVTMFDDYANGRRCLNTSTPIFGEDGEVWRVIACIRDITELEEMSARLVELERANQTYKSRLQTLETGDNYGIVGNSAATGHLRQGVLKAAGTDAVALILGETGTGKSLTAKAIHDMSARKDGPFIALNCGGIPPSLVESELFGYERGAFTGASKGGKVGVFELASGGTLFLDEIAELPMPMQATLLHVLDDYTFRRVGGTREVKADVRVIAATNKPLGDLVTAGEFRQDLFYRLRVVVVNIPALRERREDIPDLARHFLRTMDGEDSRKSFAPAVLAALVGYGWPGNVRELRALVQYLLTMSEGDVFRMEDLPSYLLADLPTSVIPAYSQSRSLKDAVEELEKSLITAALNDMGSTYKAAERLQVSQSTIVRKAQRYRIGLAAVTH